MKMNIKKHLLLAALFTVLLLFITVPVAFAGPATQVLVANRTLTAGNPYLLNSGSYGTAANWNVFFDTSTTPTPTLRLKDASFSTLTSGTVNIMVVLGGDVIVELEGNNFLTYSGSKAGSLHGLFCQHGTITFTESAATGTLTIDLHNDAGGTTVVGIREDSYDVYIESGTVDITVYGALSTGIRCTQDVAMIGGQVSIDVTGSTTAIGVRAEGSFGLSGGNITSVAKGYAGGSLYAGDVRVTGGYGEFTSQEGVSGLYWPAGTQDDELIVTCGKVIFSSEEEPAIYDTTSTPRSPSVSGDILVSALSSGAGKTSWTPAMGQLLNNPSFRYVEMIGDCGGSTSPQTGDAGRPWLWLGIGFSALLVGASALWIYRRRRAKTA